MNVSEDEIRLSALWSNETELDFCYQSHIYTVSSVYFNQTLISCAHWTKKCLISMTKLHALCYELNSVDFNLLISIGDG
jgi:hypothetical protein